MRTRWFNAIVLLTLLLGMIFPMAAQAAPTTAPLTAPESQEPVEIEVEEALRAQLAADETVGYLIYFKEKPDLSPAYKMDWISRGRFVANALQQTALRSQANVRAYLDARGVKYRSFWIENVISVESSNRATFNGLLAFPEIGALRQHRVLGLIEPQRVEAPSAPQAVEPNIAHVMADQVWAQGYTGQGMVVANIDTGVRYTHQALVNQYRGNLGGTFDHNYNWWDPYGDHPTSPADDNGHGSHTMGTMVGDDGGANQIGMAPGAQWIACRGCNTNQCSDTALLECAQFMAAPWDLNQANANPDKRPNAVNNSWGDCGRSYDPWYQGVVDAWHAMGIYPVFSNGNASNCGYPAPPGLNTVGNPARYGNVTGVGSSGRDNGQYATHSNWGPTDNPDTVNPHPGWEDLKPQVLAPGVNIRSSVNSGDTAYQGGWSGTSMSAPHVTGLVALMWSAAPCLMGDYATTENIIENTATPIPYDDGTGGGAHVPNYAAGWGEINALAAVMAAANECGDSVIAGKVTDASTNAAVAGAKVVAANANVRRKTTSDANGLYAMTVFSGTYTLTASRYGYRTAVVPGVVATSGATTTQNIPLTPAAYYEVSGKVTDAVTGWPLYAHISITGDPVDPLAPDNSVWTNPATGEYSLMLAEGVTYTFEVNAWAAGYIPAEGPVGPLTQDTTADFALQPNMTTCTAPGYYFINGLMANFEDKTFPPAGWTVVNNGGNCEWVGDDPGGRGNLTGGTGKFAIADSDNCGSSSTMNTDLISPPFDVSGLSTVNFSFAYDYNNYQSGEVAAVDVSADGGATWTNVVRWTTDQRGPATFTQDVTALLAGSTQARVRFHYYAPGWDWWWEVDNVVLGNPVCVAPADGGLVVGNVYDANYPTTALNGATVVNALGGETTAVATPGDPAVADGFYTLFAPSGAQVFTATMKGGYAPDTATVNVVDGDTVRQDFYLPAGLLNATPQGIDVTVELGYTTSDNLTLSNTGGVPATFEFMEREGQFAPIDIPAFVGNVSAAPDVPVSTARAPKAADAVEMPKAPQAFPLGGEALAYAIDLFTGNLVTFLNTSPGTWTIIGNTGLNGPFAGDFLNGDFSQMYVLDYYANALYSVNTTNAQATLIGPSIPNGVWTGMTGSVDGTLYAASTDGSQSYLYTLDPATGAATLIGEITNAPVIIDIAINAAGQMYGVEIMNDVLVGIDPATGAGTVIGGLGFNASYAQGMDFEEESNVLYLAAFNVGTFMGELRIADTNTGATVPVGTFPGGAEVDCLAFATGGKADVPWLTETPVTGTVSAAGTIPVLVGFDAAYVDQPGEYHAELIVKNNTPYGKFNVPVTMTVTAPRSWGKLTGTVTGLGVCDADPAPLEEAQVWVQSATGAEWVLETGEDGKYHLWLDQAHSPLTVTVSAPDYYGQATGVVVQQGQTTVVNFDLRLLKPCLSSNPAAFDVTLPMGDNTVEPLTLLNSGAGDAVYEFMELPIGFTPMRATAQTLLASRLDAARQRLEGYSSQAMPDGTPQSLKAFSVSGLPAPAVQPVTPRVPGGALQGVSFYYDRGVFDADYPGLPVEGYENGSMPDGTVDVVPHPLDEYSDNAYFDPGDILPGIQFWATNDHSGEEIAVLGTNFMGNPSKTAVANYFSDSYHIVFNPPVQAAGMDLQEFMGSYSCQVDVYNADGVLLGSDVTSCNEAGIFWGVASPMDPVAEIVITSLGGGAQGADNIAFGNMAGGIPWLSESPETGFILADGNAVVDLTFDAGVPETMQPGTYTGQLKVKSNAANNVPSIPVTLTVTPPDTWGKLAGTVTGLGYCDVATPTLLEGAEVLVESSTGMVAWLLESDANGAYSFWLDAAHSPLTLTVAYPDHVTKVFTNVVVTAGQTTVRDAALRWDKPCLTVNPTLFDVTLTLGDSMTRSLSLVNQGAAETPFRFTERNGGWIISRALFEGPTVNVGGNALRLGPTTPRSGASGVTPTADVIQDGSFEDGTPNGFWDEYSTNFGTPICDVPSCGTGTGTGPRTGSFWVWFGGINAYEEGWVAQDVTIPTGFATLSFWLEQIVCGSPTDYMQVLIDGEEVFFTDGNSPICGVLGYSEVVVDVTDYADGGVHNIMFYSESTGGSNIFVDDVVLDVLEGPVDIPWLFEDPESGSVPADSTATVELTFDAGVPEVAQPGVYFGNLFVNSDDPVNAKIAIPVTMTVLPPASWGRLQGTVTGAGYCDADPHPLEGAEVLIESWMTRTTTVMGTLLTEDFEANNGGYTHGGTQDEWAWGTPTAWPNACASGAFCWGTDLTGNYNNSADQYLQSPVIDLSGTTPGDSLTVVWQQAWSLESGWDYGYAEVSINGGGWTQMWSGTGTNNNWTEMTYDISAAAGGTVQFRWRLTSDGSVTYPGYYVDNVRILGPVEAVEPVNWLLHTDANGNYQVWIDEMYSPVTITVSYPDYQKGEAIVTVTGGTTVTQDFDLRMLAPCVQAQPPALHATLELGDTATQVFTLTNTGLLDTDWTLTEQNLGAPTVTPPGVVVLFSEDFEGAFPPAGWNVVENIGSCQWESSATTGYTNQTGGSGLFADANSDWCGTGMNTELWTPSLDLSAASAPVLSFHSDFNDYGGADDGYVDISTNGGATWTNLLHYDGVDVRGPWLEEIDLSAYAGQSNVLIRFHYVAGGYDWYWQVDDVQVSDVDQVIWLAENPASGNLAADTGVQAVDVDFDASVVPQPGDYVADLWINSDDPFAPLVLPVTMTVTPPATWGHLLGVVYSLGRCDVTTATLAGAQVVIWDSGGTAVVTLTTDISGTYSYWLPTGDYTVTVTAADHVPAAPAVVTVPAAGAVTQDFSLTWLGPCLSVATVDYHLTLPMGMSDTLPMTLTNAGLANADFAFSDIQVGFVPSGLLMLQRSVPAYPPVSGGPEAAAELEGTEAPKGEVPTPSPLARISVPFAPIAALYDNGPLVNSPGTGAGGADESMLQSVSLGMGTYGFGHQAYYGNRIADDFTVTGSGWYVDTITFFAYQTGSGLVSTITAVNLQIWNGVPGAPGSVVVFGDTTTNRLVNTTWSGIYRVLETTSGNTDRPIMANTVKVGVMLPPGTYWLDWQSDGTLSSGPWAPPVTINGQATTGNALQYTSDTGAWGAALDIGTGTQQDFPFIIAGQDAPWLFEIPDAGTVPATGQTVVDILMDANYVQAPGEYYGMIMLATTDTGLASATYPATLTVTLPDTFGQITGTVTGLGPCDDATNPVPLEGAEVTVASATRTWTTFTDANGGYSLWLDAAHSPVTITVAADDYVAATVTGVTVISGTTTVQNFGLSPEAPCMNVAPTSIHETLTLGDSVTVPLTINNIGAADLNWALSESDEGFVVRAPVHIAAASGDFPRGTEPASVGAAPVQSPPKLQVTPEAPVTILSPGTVGYATEPNIGQFLSMDVDTPQTFNLIAPFADVVWAGDFDDDGVLYAIDSATQQLVTINPATGAATPVGAIASSGGESWTGMAYDPTNDTMYASSTSCGSSSTLYSVNTATGAATVIGQITNAPCAIALAVDDAGTLFTYDIVNDVLLSVNKATGAGTVIGSIGFNANYGQGMDFDYASGQLYMAAFNSGTFQGELRVVDRTTGATALVGVLGQTTPGGTNQLGWLALPSGGGDAPWLFEDPTSGTTPAGDTSTVTVTLDAGVPEVVQPGDYFATLKAKGDNATVEVPVTMTVEPPATWGKLEGLVQGLGYCNAVTTPLQGAVVFVESAVTEWVTYTMDSVVYEQDFESSDGGYTHSGAQDEWQWGTPTAWPYGCASGAYCWGTDLAGDYNAYADQTLLSPVIDLSGVTAGTPLTARWQQALYIESATWDHAYAEVSINGGAWTQMWAHTGGTTQSSWAEKTFDISAAAGGTVRFRWRLTSDGSVQYPGYYIDAVRITMPVEVSEERPVNWALTTNTAGEYGWWFDTAYNPLTVTVSHEGGYAEQVFTGVEIVSGTVTTLNANLLWLQPCLTVAPQALVLNVPMGTTSTVALNLANLGAVTGTFLLNEWSKGFNPLGPLATGGPDAFGYQYADSNDLDIRPVYDFVDISGVGTALTLGDNAYAEVPIGFDFKFYGASAVAPNTYATVFVGSNGFLSFGAGSTDLSPDPVLPNPTLPNNLIAAAWADLVPGVVHYQSFAQCPYNPSGTAVDACFIVQYSAFTHKDGSPAGTWEVILFRSGSILMQYAEVDAPDATTGIENQLGLVGLTYMPNLADELAICFAYPGKSLDCQSKQVTWLDTDVDKGDIAAGDAAVVNVTFDARVPEVYAPGDYLAELRLVSNDPYRSFQVIPVTMTVAQPASLARLNGVVTGWSQCDAESAPLEGARVEIATRSGDSFVLATDAQGAYGAWLKVGDAYTVTISKPGYVPVTLTGTATAGMPSQAVNLRVNAPCVSLSPGGFEVALAQHRSVTHTLTIRNTGAGDFAFDRISGWSLWLSGNPMSGVVPAGGTLDVTLVFNAADLDVGVYRTLLEVIHKDLTVGRLFIRPVQMTVVAEGAILSPTQMAQQGNPGETVTYVLTVTNFASTAAGFNVLTAGNAWTTNAPATLNVAAGGSATFSVMVTIPDAAHSGDTDAVTVTIRSQGDDKQVGSAILQTTVAEQPVVLALTKTAAPALVLPGNTIAYTITLANNGNDPVTIALSDPIPANTTYLAGSVSGATLQDPPGAIVWEGELAKGAQRTITFKVTVNAGVAEGTVITNTVTATVAGTPYTARATVTVGRVTPLYHYIYLPLVLRNAQ